MANSSSNLDLISASQANKEVTANSLFDAASPAMLYGRRASATAALTWGYYGGTVSISGTPTQVANGTVALAASATNYVEADPSTGAVSVNTTGFTAGRTPLYSVVTGTATVASYTDLRVLGGGGSGTVKSVNTKTPDGSGAVTLSASDVGADASGAASSAVSAHDAATDPHPQYLTQARGDARYPLASTEGQANGLATLGGDGKVPTSQLPASATAGGTVTSVDLSVPGLLYTVSGNPVTTSGTLTFSLKTQAANTFLAGPTSGAAAVPTMRAITGADLPVFGASGTNHAPGAVPDPGATVGTTRFLREDGTWTVPAGAGTPGGSTTQLQFNDGGVLAGASGLAWDKTNNILYVGAGTTPGLIKGGTAASATSTGVSVTIKGGAGGSTSGIGGDVTIAGGDPTTNASGAAGANVNIVGGTGSGGSAGGKVIITGGPAAPTSGAPGGDISISGAPGTSTGTGGAGGAVTISGGDSSGTVGLVTGGVTIKGGNSSSTASATGGTVAISSGNGGSNANGGALNLSAGSGGNNNGAGGAVTISGGTSGSNKDGGAVTIQGGTGGSSGMAGGAVNIYGGVPASGNGGVVNIVGAAGVGTNKNGGNINLTPGAATGTGTPGNVVLNNSGAALPTSTTGGFVCIPTCAGAPTGTPANFPTGSAPIVYDTTNLKLMTYSGGAWNTVGGSGSGGSYSVFGASGTSHSSGLVPDPGATAGAIKFLREDSTWAVPASGGFGNGEAAFTAPAVANFTQTNFGTTGTATVAENFTAADGTAGIRLRERGDGSNTNHLRSLLKTAPGGTTWTLLARLRTNTLITQWQGLGITLNDSSSGKSIFYGWAYDSGPLAYITWGGANTYGTPSNVANPSGGMPHDCWFGFYYDGTYLNFLYSRDGNYFVILKRTGLTDYLPNAPTAGGICINPNCFGTTTQATVLECLSFYYASGAPPVSYS